MKLTAGEVDRMISEAVAEIGTKVPMNTQDAADIVLAEYFVAKKLTQLVKPRVDKYEKAVKEAVKNGQPGNMKTENFARTISFGTPRASFDKDDFIAKVAAQFKVPKHKLVELAADCTKLSATPLSIDVEYVGDI